MGHDAIVIGAGIGGLVAAGMLAGEGRKVLVLERAGHPGGTAYAFHRAGAAFPMGPLGFSSPGIVTNCLARAGARMPGLSRARYRLRAFGLWLELSRPLAETARALGEAWPADAQGVRIFCDQMERLGRALDAQEDPEERGLLEKAGRVAAGDYLRDLILAPEARRVLGSIGTGQPYSNLPLLAAQWRLMTREGIWMAEGGTQALADALLAAARARGVEVRFKAEVAQVLVADGRARGVALAGGEEIEAAAVISNADYKTTFLRLVADEHLPEEFFQQVFFSRQTDSALQVSVALDPAAADLSAFEEADRIIYRRAGESLEPDWRLPELPPGMLSGAELEVALYARDAAAATVVIRTAASHSHFARFRILPKTRRPAYAPYKERLGRELLTEVEHLLPGISASTRTLDVATPLTFEERGGRSAGAIAGWSWDFGANPDCGPRELVRTPVAGLYMAGCQAYSSLFLGGLPSAALSGVRAAEAALAGAGPENRVELPGGNAPDFF